MESNMWRVSLRDEGGSNIIPSDNCNNTGGAMPFPKFIANNIYKCKNTTQLKELYHATLGYPSVSTCCKAIKTGYFQGWTGLTSNHVHQFIKVCNETEKGHMKQQSQGKNLQRVASTIMNPWQQNRKNLPTIGATMST